MTERLDIDWSLLGELFAQPQLPSVEVVQQQFLARDLFAGLFSDKQNLDQRLRTTGVDSKSGQELIGERRDLELAGYLLSDQSIFGQLASSHSGLSRADIANAILREVVTERVKDELPWDMPSGELVFRYANQVQSDLLVFRDAYLGTKTLQELLQEIKPTEAKKPMPNPLVHGSPQAYIGADTLLKYFPMMDHPNPQVQSISDLRYILAATMVCEMTRDQRIRKEVSALYLNREVNAQVKLIYAAMQFNIGYMGFMASVIRGTK